MAEVASFTFNPFQENTYIVFDETKECVLIDPGCHSKDEQDRLKSFIDDQQLNPKYLLLTHAHFDHVLGLSWVKETYGLSPIMHEEEKPILEAVPQLGDMYAIPVEEPPKPEAFLEEGDEIRFGETVLKVLFTPGHSPGHVTFYCRKDGFVISGDVIFRQSVGRTDLPGGDRETLFESIRQEIYALPDETIIYNGHGPKTTVEYEKAHNSFVRAE